MAAGGPRGREVHRVAGPRSPFPAGPQTPDRAGTGTYSPIVGDAPVGYGSPRAPLPPFTKRPALRSAAGLPVLTAEGSAAVTLHRADPGTHRDGSHARQ